MMGEMYTAVLQAVEEGVKNRPPPETPNITGLTGQR
jgi:hypothetical protein